MFKATAIGITFFLLGLVAGMGAVSTADSNIRVEVAGGQCRHHLAADASWSYRDWGSYQSNMELQPSCLQAGVSWMPYWKGFGKTRLGLRIAYVDLGNITADNTFPLDELEYFRAKETKTPVNSPTYSFHGNGGSRGMTMGLASEFPLAWGIHVGPEAGAAFLYSRWNAYFPNQEEESPVGGCGKGWACANGWHATAYAGVTVRYEWLQISARRYFNAHASNTNSPDTRSALFIGPTTGPVDSILIGISIPL